MRQLKYSDIQQLLALKVVAFVILGHLVKELFSQLGENSITGLKVIQSRVTSLSAEDEDIILNISNTIILLQGPSHK